MADTRGRAATRAVRAGSGAGSKRAGDEAARLHALPDAGTRSLDIPPGKPFTAARSLDRVSTARLAGVAARSNAGLAGRINFALTELAFDEARYGAGDCPEI